MKTFAAGPSDQSARVVPPAGIDDEAKVKDCALAECAAKPTIKKIANEA